MTIQEAAKILYDGYAEEAGWKTFNGDPMPKYDEQENRIVKRWEAAAKALLDAMGDDEAQTEVGE